LKDEDDTFELLVWHLRELVYPSQEKSDGNEDKNKRLTLVQSLLLNKHRETRLKAELETSLGDTVI